MQAAHDMLFVGADVASWDHVDFPGVVPRTFLAPAAAAALAAPAVALLRAFSVSKLAAGVAVRVALACMGIAALSRLRGAVARTAAARAGAFFMLLSALQFHLPFYLSRPLPNTFAMVLTSLAAADWLDGSAPARALALLAATTAAVRCDVLLLAGCVGLHVLITRAVPLKRAIAVSLAAGLGAAAASVAVDSLLWRRAVWPEGAVFWFNTAENKSSAWGTSPWHWYASSALPRALLGGLPAALAGAALPPARPPLAAAAGFAALYSALPHKELRFLLPVLPLFNVAAAMALAAAWRRRGVAGKGLAAFALAATATAAAGFAAAAARNYPGGVALMRLHALAAGDASAHPHAWPPRAHVGAFAAMTGVTRFGEAGPPWRYSKEEGLRDDALAGRGFTHLLSGAATVPGFDAVEAVHAFAGLDAPRSPGAALARLRERGVWRLVGFRSAPAVWVHRRARPRDEA
jgi:alpha-1,6-mannosyltransferase